MTTKSTTILAIETSCDETSVAVIDCSGTKSKPKYKLRSNIVSSQVKLHEQYGGVVPNLAKREHIKNLPMVLKTALGEASVLTPENEIDVIAVTVGPGLEPALWTGITFAQDLAQKWKKPVVAANHMEGHLVTPLLSKSQKEYEFPAIALLVSGGHTQLALVKNFGDYKIIGDTVDDAAGEAFDKVARMLDLGYPGGPMISKLGKTGNRYTYSFPRPMINHKNYNFSFSGLKTAVLYTLRDLNEKKELYSKNDIAASFEDAVVDVLISKTIKAVREYGAKTCILGGGVAANELLRKRLTAAIKEDITTKLFLPEAELTGDNAAMIGASAYFHVLDDDFTDWKKLVANATLSL
ncbi:MAG: tRNA (adenosine(37)-N6)-threonylcarbamoyltransferase complex transferase subunit TsaD [bacterium]|nr:tRNA (adenosine(37)-N6)-threonylcarbamoyltransferase complex transferase subunit TsaD [bacterium]